MTLPMTDATALDLDALDTGQLNMYANDGSDEVQRTFATRRLEVLHFEVHRCDNAGQQDEELIMSALRHFALRVGVMDGGELSTLDDGMQLQARLIYESGRLVDEVSATLEPPLLGGDAIVGKDGTASFRLRITVLSSLCRSSKFRVRVSAVDTHAAPVATVTSQVRTITKLRRPSKTVPSLHSSLQSPVPSPVGSAPRELGWDVLDISRAAAEANAPTSSALPIKRARHHIEELWDQVHANGALLLELQRQQAALSAIFKGLRGCRN